MEALYQSREADYSLSMPLAPIVCYYSSAKPQSGYSGAVRGYGEKLALALGYDACALADLPREVVPEISIGLEGHDWPDGLQPAHALKARPYADQHGFGPSMHPLRAPQLEALRSPAKQERKGLIIIANPHWLAERAEQWAKDLAMWAANQALEEVMVTNSPRTNVLAWEVFSSEALKVGFKSMIINDINGSNGYLSALANSDAICLLGTSRSMAAEAAMSHAPIWVAFDNLEDENHFFAAIQQDFLPLRERFSPFKLQNSSEEVLFAPCDVTEGYVRAALAQIRREKAA